MRKPDEETKRGEKQWQGLAPSQTLLNTALAFQRQSKETHLIYSDLKYN